VEKREIEAEREKRGENKKVAWTEKNDMEQLHVDTPSFPTTMLNACKDTMPSSNARSRLMAKFL